jgi:hypothetical protein
MLIRNAGLSGSLSALLFALSPDCAYVIAHVFSTVKLRVLKFTKE